MPSLSSTTMNTDFETTERLIDASDVALLSSIDPNGFPNTRALLPPRKREGLKHFFFTTNTSSVKVAQLTTNPKACLYFYHSGTFVGAMLVGTAEVLQDATSKAMIWRQGDEMYYAKGVGDPDYAVLKFTAHTLRYYSDFNPRGYPLNDMHVATSKSTNK